MDWFAKSVSLAYFPSKDGPLKDKWVRLRGVAKRMRLSPRAREKLEWIIFYLTVGKGNATATASYFGISRKTFHKWLNRFDEKNLKSLEETSRAPYKKREWTVTLDEEERVIKLRKESKKKWGKEKLRVRYQKVYGEDISTNKIQKIINKHKLYPDYNEHIKKLKAKAKRAKKQKMLIYHIEKKKEFGFLWRIDAIIEYWYGSRRIIFTAMEEITKIAFARTYKTNSSRFATDFLKRLMYLVEGKVNIIHSDNGVEFAGKFEKACKTLAIQQAYSRPRTPKDNPALERFNWTLEDEWLSVSDVGLDDIRKANQDLTDWLITYNSIRPHQALDYLTPLEYADKHYFKVLPMYPSSTAKIISP